MKKFIISVLCVAVFFIGLGGLLETVGAKFKSDEKALILIKQAREAIGGDANINNVRSLSVVGKVTKTFDFDGSSRSEQGDWELNLQLPNQLSKMIKLNREGGEGNEEVVRKNVVIINRSDSADKTFVMPEGENGGEKKLVIIKKGDGEPTILSEKGDSVDGKKVVINKDVRVIGNGESSHQNELFRTTLSLLLTAPEGSDVTYIYAGESSVDGSSCKIVEAKTGESAVRLYLDKSSHLPRMITFQNAKPMIFKFKKDDAAAGDKQENVFFRQAGAPETAEFQVKFSDYRSVNGVQMPYKWTQTIGDKDDETVDVSSYEVNPANIAEKFNKTPQKIMIRTKKPE